MSDAISRLSTSGTGPPGRPRATLAAGALIVLAGAWAYSNSFRGPFILDDLPSIPENATIRHLWPLGPVLFDARFATVVGRPILNLSLALNYACGGLDVQGYHLVNLLLHLGAGLVLFGVVRRTLRLPSMRDRFGQASTALALAVALLWTVHPLLAQAVTYVVQRAEMIVGLFYLLTLYCLVRAAATARPLAWDVAAAAACALGMATKEVMATAPLVALLYDRTFLAGSFRDALRERWRLYASLAATWAILAALVATSGGREHSAGFGFGMTSWQYARTQFGFIVEYLRLVFWPSPLVLDYGAATADTASEIVPYAILIALLVAGTVLTCRRQPAAGFAGAWFFLILAPTSSVVPLVTQVAAQHRMYLPLAGVLALVACAAYRLGGRALRRLVPADRRRTDLGWGLAAAAVLGVAAALGYVTHLRNEDFRSALSIWEDTVRKCPGNTRARSNLGALLTASGNPARGLEELNEAIRLRPDYVEAYLNRSVAWTQLGRYDLAVQDASQVLVLAPDHADANYSRGIAYIKAGRWADALADFNTAVAIQPHFAAAYNDRGSTHFEMGHYEEALRDYSRAIQEDPAFAQAYGNRAAADLLLKDYDRAWADVQRSRQLGDEPRAELIRRLTEASGRTR